MRTAQLDHLTRAIDYHQAMADHHGSLVDQAEVAMPARSRRMTASAEPPRYSDDSRISEMHAGAAADLRDLVGSAAPVHAIDATREAQTIKRETRSARRR